LASACRRLSEALVALGRAQEAEDALRRFLASQAKWLADHRDHPGLTSGYVGTLTSKLGWTYHQLGCVLALRGRTVESANAFRQAIDLFETGKDTYPLAWTLANCPAVQFRDQERALPLSKKQLQLEPLSDDYWRILGCAQYRLGKWDEASEALQKVLQIRSGEGLDWFLLAMIDWRRGDYKEARKWYDKAADWMVTNRTGNAEVHLVQAEAAALLGVARPAKKKDESPPKKQ
jgi:tetratricopeptide (TPR) repeat protein